MSSKPYTEETDTSPEAILAAVNTINSECLEEWVISSKELNTARKVFPIFTYLTRADLPPTTDQILSDPRVKALVGLIERASKMVDPCYPDKHKTWQEEAIVALARLKEAS
jgi:hypothetical protein